MITQNLKMEYLLQNQAFAEITINDALETLDAFVFNIVQNFIDVLPQNPQIADAYIIDNESSVDHNKIAIYLQNKGWSKLYPQNGASFYLLENNQNYRFINGQWVRQVVSEVQSNWIEASVDSPSFIKNKPSFHTVATSGSYNDLTNKPYLHSVASSGNYNELINKPMVSHIVGDIKHSAQNADHNGWLLCDGREVLRTQYSLLFGLIGTTFGVGNGTTTFKLPDARGRVLGVVGLGAGLTVRTIGDVVGTQTHTLSNAEMPSHSHGYSSVDNTNFTVQHTTGGGISGIPRNTPGWSNYSPAEWFTNVMQIANSGGGQPHNNMQPTLFIGGVFIFSGN